MVGHEHKQTEMWSSKTWLPQSFCFTANTGYYTVYVILSTFIQSEVSSL